MGTIGQGQNRALFLRLFYEVSAGSIVFYMSGTYKNIILTTHAAERLRQRSISECAVAEVVGHPDKKYFDKNNSTKFIRNYNGRKYHVVAQWKPSEQKWLIVSAWVRGENDSEPLSTTLILLPFRVIWWVFKKLFSKK